MMNQFHVSHCSHTDNNSSYFFCSAGPKKKTKKSRKHAPRMKERDTNPKMERMHNVDAVHLLLLELIESADE